MTDEYKRSRQNEFLSALKAALSNETFVKLSLGNYQGKDEQLKKVLITPTRIKNRVQLKFIYQYKTNDKTKNFDYKTGYDIIRDFLKVDFYTATLFTTEFDIVYENLFNKKIKIKKKSPTYSNKPSLSHDHQKHREITPETSFLYRLGISSPDGKIRKVGQDKYKQINQFINLLTPALRRLPKNKSLSIIDMGSGKGYLTFALYHHLHKNLNLPVQMKGIEMRADLVDLCNNIAAVEQMTGLTFEQGMIETFQAEACDVLIALHACDTATDDAISQGINSRAQIIVVAPCCQKQIRRELEARHKATDLEFVNRHGIFLERQAAMITDSIRALVLEYAGYKVKVLEFISDEHTPKNVMIIATHKSNHPDKNKLKEIHLALDYFGIENHRLLENMGMNKSEN